LSSGSSDEDAFLTEAPPDYSDIVIDPLVSTTGREDQVTVSFNASHSNVPAQVVIDNYQPPLPLRQVQTSHSLLIQLCFTYLWFTCACTPLLYLLQQLATCSV